MIDREENQSIIKLAKDCSSSIVGQNEASSYISENSAAISTTFDFDTILFSSTLYQQAQRSHLRQAIRATRNQTTELPLAQVPSTDNTVDTSRSHHGGDDDSLEGITTEEPRQLANVARLENAIATSSQDKHNETDVAVSNMRPILQTRDRIEQGLIKNQLTSQPKTFYLRNLWKNRQRRNESAVRLASTEHKVTEHTITEHKVIKHKVLILGISGSGKSTMMKALN